MKRTGNDIAIRIPFSFRVAIIKVHVVVSDILWRVSSGRRWERWEGLTRKPSDFMYLAVSRMRFSLMSHCGRQSEGEGEMGESTNVICIPGYTANARQSAEHECIGI